MFLQDLGQFSTQRNLTDVFEEDRYDSTHQVHHPGHADKVTELDDRSHI